MHKASKRNFFLTTKWNSRKTKFRHDFIWNRTEHFVLCGKQKKSIIYSSKYFVNTSLCNWNWNWNQVASRQLNTFPGLCALRERKGNVLNFSSNRLPNNEPWNIQHGNGKTKHTHETKRNWQLAKEKPQNNSAIWQTTPRTRTQTQTQSQTRTEVAHTHRVEKWQNANRKNGRKSNEKCIMKIRNVRAKETKKKKKNNFSAKYYLQ